MRKFLKFWEKAWRDFDNESPYIQWIITAFFAFMTLLWGVYLYQKITGNY